MEIKELSASVVARKMHFLAKCQEEIGGHPDHWRRLDPILSAGQSSARLNIYNHYPLFFCGAFPTPPGVLAELAYCARIALDYILLYDLQVDVSLDKRNSALALFASQAFAREYQRCLSSLLPEPARASLWAALEHCERSSASAIMRELTQRQTPLTQFDTGDIQRVSVGKAALSRLAIHALHALCTENANLTSTRDHLIASNDAFNHARQLVDDVQDWRIDYEAGNYTWILCETLQSLGVSEVAFANKNLPSATEVGLHLFTRFALPHLSSAKNALLDSQANIVSAQRGEGFEMWSQMTGNYLNKISKIELSIQNALMRAQSLASSSTTVSTQQSARLVDQIDRAVSRGVQFLAVQQEENGSWRDFLTQAGHSNRWVTGFVGSMLADVTPARQLCERASLWLSANGIPSGGWSYNEDVPLDADSTVWALRLLNHDCGLQLPTGQRELHLHALRQHKQQDGGFATYQWPDEIRNYMQLDSRHPLSAWCASQTCVTTATLGCLARMQSGVSSSELNALADSVLSRQNPDGSWQSYWWLGEVYATTMAIDGLICANRLTAAVANAALLWLMHSQSPNGAWLVNGAPRDVDAAFTSALALQSLISLRKHTDRAMRDDVLTVIKRGLHWLIDTQPADGGWQQSAPLLVPDPEDFTPWKSRNWNREASRGTGILRLDHRRTFSTSAAVNALAKARQTLLEANAE